jgi:transketolase
MREAALMAIHELAKRDSRVVFIGSDLGPGTLASFKSQFPCRFFMEGIAEQHIIGMASGLALEGFIPFVNTIATFLTRRCLEQIIVDMCLQRMPVRLIGYGGGVVYAPLGPTHQAIEDFALLRALPNMTIIAPCDAFEIEKLIPLTIAWPDPIYVRLSKGGEPIIAPRHHHYAIGRAVPMRNGSDIAIISTGIMTQRALGAAEVLHESGISAAVLHCHTVKPLDQECIRSFAAGKKLVVTVEEHVRTGGLGSAVLETLSDHCATDRIPVRRLGLPDCFSVHYGSHEELLDIAGLNADQIICTITSALRDHKCAARERMS